MSTAPDPKLSDSGVGSVADTTDESSETALINKRKAHISRIRLDKGLDADSTSVGPTNNVEDLTEALNVLSKQLYTEPTHFLLEFIQNADDNSYATNVLPTIQFNSAAGHLLIKCNETGFEANNVEAICRIAKSTKKDHSKGFIGQKGIGFKSSFKIADVVWVSSNHYTFRFDRDGPLGMIAPIWCPFPAQADENQTQFRLKLAESSDEPTENHLQRQLKSLDSTLLLFLRKLKQIWVSIDDGRGAAQSKVVRRFLRDDYTENGGEMINISVDTAQSRATNQGIDYLIVRHTATGMPLEAKRAGLKTSEVILAFAFSKGRPILRTQKAYAFLPIRESGFTFLIQADFILVANREDIESSNAWNLSLLSALAQCFANAVKRFNQPNANHLRFLWLEFFREHPARTNFFAPLEQKIYKVLQNLDVLESLNGTFIKPREACSVPSTYCDANGRFVLLEAPVSISYISDEYRKHDPSFQVLKQLGVEIMSPTRVLDILKTYLKEDMKSFTCHPAQWHDNLARVLADIGLTHRLRDLPLIPLQNGDWVRSDRGQTYFEADDATVLGKLPQGIKDLLLVSKEATANPAQHRLLAALGVRTLDKQEVCRLILALHGDCKPPNVSADDLIGHALYLYEATKSGGPLSKPARLWVVSAIESFHTARGLYFDTSDTNCLALSKVLPQDVWRGYFLSPTYLSQFKSNQQTKWFKWLENTLGLRTTIRISRDNETLTAELRYLIEHIESSELLEVILGSWLKDASVLKHDAIKQKLRAINVKCQNGSQARLEQCCLPIPALDNAAAAGIPILTLKNPTDAKWNRFGQLGVLTKPDVDFYLRCLSLVPTRKLSFSQLVALYKCIENVATNDLPRVRKIFKENATIFVPQVGRWVSSSDCVWETIPGAYGDYALAKHYPSLEHLFLEHLQLKTATIEDVIEKLRLVSNRQQKDDHKLTKLLLFALSEFLVKVPRDFVKLKGAGSLENVPVMPTIKDDSPDRAIVLYPLNKPEWWFCDRHDYYKCFVDLESIIFADFEIKSFLELKPLCTAIGQAWPGEERCLSKKVTEEPAVGDETTFSVQMTTFLRSKLIHIRRLVRKACGPNKDRLQPKLDTLHRLRVHIAPKMALGVRLDCSHRTKPLQGRPIEREVIHRVTSHQGKTDLCIFLREELPTVSICTALSDVLKEFCDIRESNLSELMLKILLFEEDKTVFDLLLTHDIGGLEDINYRPLPVQDESSATTSLITDTEYAASTTDSMTIAIAGLQLGTLPGETTNRATEADGMSDLTMLQKDLDVGHRSAQTSHRRGTQARNPQPRASRTSGAIAKDSYIGNTVTMRPATHATTFKSDSDQQRYYEIGIEGERYVFRLLKDVLKAGFTENMWTSELRGAAGSEFSAWKPTDTSAFYCDFTVPDPKGLLAAWLEVHHGIHLCKDQESTRTFHIEVKSTVNDVEEPFHMSGAQMQRCKELEGNRTEVFIIIRVYHIFVNDGPKHVVYHDPAAMIYGKLLLFDADEYLCVAKSRT